MLSIFVLFGLILQEVVSFFSIVFWQMGTQVFPLCLNLQLKCAVMHHMIDLVCYRHS